MRTAAPPLPSPVMCTACVAQGITYVGGAVVSLRVMAARAQAKRLRAAAVDDDEDVAAAAER